MPRPTSKRQRALDQLDIARDAIAKAITLLGGRIRVRSVKKNQRVFTVRQYLESIDSRINVSRDLLQIDEIVSIPIKPDPNPPDFARLFPAIANAKRRPCKHVWNTAAEPIACEKCGVVHSTELRDDFEREYDATRRPQC